MSDVVGGWSLSPSCCQVQIFMNGLSKGALVMCRVIEIVLG